MSKVEVPNLIMENLPPDEERWVMECTLAVERTESLGESYKSTRVDWSGFASHEVLDAMLGIMSSLASSGEIE